MAEKQKEQKSVDLVTILKNYFADTPKEQQEKDWAELKHLNEVGIDVEIAFSAKDSELQEETYFIPDGFHAEIIGDKVVIKRGEQKPACEMICTTTWKPSGEQMAYLAASIEESNENAILKSLYQDLMKLREEKV